VPGAAPESVQAVAAGKKGVELMYPADDAAAAFLQVARRGLTYPLIAIPILC